MSTPMNQPSDERMGSAPRDALRDRPNHWHVLSRPRVEPVAVERQPWLMRLVLRLTRSRTDAQGERPVTLNVFATMAHDRGLFYRWLLFAARLMPYGKLPRADSERIILRVGFRTGSWYEWVQHVRIGKAVGLRADEIDDLQLDNAPGWSERTRVLMRATDALIRHHHLDDDLWQKLRGQLSEKQILEFCMLVGHYVMLAMTLNTLGVAVEPQYQTPR